MGKLTKQDIMRRAIDECMCEMYAKACPSVDWKKLCADYEAQYLEAENNGDEKKLEELKAIRIYERYYLPSEEFKYILDKYISAYNYDEKWHSNVDTVLEYLTDGGLTDKYISEQVDEDGFKHPGYRTAEPVPALKEQIRKIMKDFDCSECAQEVADKITNKVIETIKLCRDFYRFDHDGSDFSMAICLGASPTSNIKTVKEYWRKQAEMNVEGAAENLQALESYKPTNPLLYWEKDEYGDEFEEIMREEEGDDWEEIYRARWEEEQIDRMKM